VDNIFLISCAILPWGLTNGPPWLVRDTWIDESPSQSTLEQPLSPQKIEKLKSFCWTSENFFGQKISSFQDLCKQQEDKIVWVKGGPRKIWDAGTRHSNRPRTNDYRYWIIRGRSRSGSDIIFGSGSSSTEASIFGSLQIRLRVGFLFFVQHFFFSKYSRKQEEIDGHFVRILPVLMKKKTHIILFWINLGNKKEAEVCYKPLQNQLLNGYFQIRQPSEFSYCLFISPVLLAALFRVVCFVMQE
jgi:hypothetical protein